MKNTFKVIIVGGGASGLFCALELLRSKNCILGEDILILEKNDRVGKKMVATGNGQGNLSNAFISEQNYHGDKTFIKAFLSNLEDVNLKEYLQDLGIYLTTEKDGKQYPLSKQANAFLDVIRGYLAQKDVNINVGEKVNLVEKVGEGYLVNTAKGKYRSRNVVLAFGGKAGSQYGTDGSSYQLAQKFGHKLTTLYPSLVQLKTNLESIKGLRGLKERVKITAYDNGIELKESVGEVLFTEYGISGNAVFSISGYLTSAKKPSVKIEFLPDFTKEQVKEILAKREYLNHIDREDKLIGLINKKIGQAIMRKCKTDSIDEIANAIKNFTLIITGNLGFSYAQVTKGGIATDQIDSKTMESKLESGLYVVGEALDVDGDCGGYNLTFAFASGIFSAKSIKENLRGE